MRSDTLTMPSPEMRRVMAEAPVGDDVFGEDPTVNRLQERAAELMGKEAGLFVASGTMANLLAVLAHARPGNEIIADSDSHLFLSEGAGAAALGGIQIRPLTTERGIISAEQLENAVRPLDDVHQPTTAAVSIENSHNRQGGVAWPLADLRQLQEAAARHQVVVHMDGARIFNAAAALVVEARVLADCADTVTFCVSKGLGAPVGSVLCGPQPFIDSARRWRKALGGGWREAGQLAAAGLHSLDNGIARLAEDHANARTLAEGLAEIDGIELDLSRVQTNIVVFNVRPMPTADFLERCSREGVLGGGGGHRVRFVTHNGVDAAGVQQTLRVVSEVLAGS